MSFTVTTRVEHLGRAPGSAPTIYEALKARLGREPSGAEIRADVQRILWDSVCDRAEAPLNNVI